jgi:hypothetical protein
MRCDNVTTHLSTCVLGPRGGCNGCNNMAGLATLGVPPEHLACRVQLFPSLARVRYSMELEQMDVHVCQYERDG